MAKLPELVHDSMSLVPSWLPPSSGPRLPLVSRASASEAQRAVLDEIIRGRRGNLAGPFLSWIHSPQLADRAQRLGAFCRYETGLPARQSELAILLTAAQWQAHTEWRLHLPIALAAGVPATTVEAVQLGLTPIFEDADDALVHRFVEELYANKRVSAECYEQAQTRWGNERVVNLVGLLGYYAFVAMTLNVFDVAGLGEGAKVHG